jgi:hypothetical protein
MHVNRRIATTAAALVLGAGLAAGTAFAAVNPAPETTVNGNAGYNATTSLITNPQGFTDGQAVVQPNQYGLTIKSGAQGAQGCNSTTGFGAQVGVLSTNLTTVYQVASSVGTIPAPGCPSGGVIPGGVVFPGLAAVPFGHHVWVDWSLVKKVKKIKVLICIVKDKYGATAPLPTGLGQKDYGKHYRCYYAYIVIKKTAVAFQAQDLDAPATPTAGDLAGVQTRYVHVPYGTRFDNSGVGVNENLTGMTACAGLAADGNTYPRTLAGPAAYVSAACQPVSVFEYATSSIAGGPATDFQTLTTAEAISPTAALPGALTAPNNSISAVNTGPHAATGSATGSHFGMNTGNAPTS